MKLYVIGLGPGEQTQMTPKAMAAIGDSDVIAGYTVYIDLIKHLTEEKEILTTPMKQEVDRCRMAIEEAVKGKPFPWYAAEMQVFTEWQGLSMN